MAKADKDTLDYVRSIGQMETVAKNAKGKINEMTNAFTELSVQYKNLTDEEKKSQFGVALSQSLDQLKTRIGESKAQLTEVNAELSNTSSKSNETGGIMQQLEGKFTLTLDAVKLFNIGVKAVGVALDVAKDAFFASEATVDEWGRTMDANRSLYEGFLNAINNGDISGFLSNINQIISAARAAYDELDRLGTMRTIQAPQISAQQAENDRLRQMIQTGRWIGAPGKDSLGMKDGQILTAPQIKALERMLNNGVQNIVSLTKNEVQQTGKTINAFYTRQSKELNMSEAEFRKGTSSMAEFDKRMAGYDAYKKWDAEAKARFAQQGGRGFVDFDKNNPYAEYRRWGTFRVDGDRYKELVQLIQQRDQQTSSMYNMQGQAYRTINRAEGITTRSIMGGGGSRGGRGGGGGSTVAPPPPEGSIAAQEAEIAILTKLWREATTQVGRDGYAGQLEAAKKTLSEMQGKVDDFLTATPVFDMNRGSEQMSLVDQIRQSIADSNIAADKATMGNLLEHMMRNGLDTANFPTRELQEMLAEGMDIPDEKWQEIVADINEKLANAGLEPIEIDVKTGNITKVAKEVGASWQDAAHAVQAVGSALQSIQDPTAKILGIIGQAIANVALGFAQATTAESGKGIWAWIAAIAGGVGTMVSTISAIHSATGYSEGGIIKGTSYSGDNIMANGGTIGLDAGEIVLNRSQAGNLAAQLSDPRAGTDRRPYLDVETIWLGLGNYLKCRGKGEIVTSK